jgi:hypothetical protein
MVLGLWGTSDKINVPPGAAHAACKTNMAQCVSPRGRQHDLLVDVLATCAALAAPRAPKVVELAKHIAR